MTDKIFLGRDKNYGELVSIEKHSWDCGWYWAFGYLGNRNLHYHFDSYLKDGKHIELKDTFSDTWLTQDQWWILRDLFIQAYALKKAAATYQHGGHQTEKAEPYRIKRQEMAADINVDLRILLDNIWNLLTEWKEKADEESSKS